MIPVAENLVFFPDSPFADWIIDRCEKLFPGLNDYYTFGENPKKIHSEKVKTIGLSEPSLKEFANQLRKYKRVIIHYHHELTAYLIELANIPSDRIIWMLWSGDLYNSPFYSRQVYLPLTYSLESVFKFPELTLFSRAKEGMKYILKKPGYYLYKKSFRRLKYVGSFFPGDVSNASQSFRKSYSHVFHGILSVNEQLDHLDLEGIPQLGDGILLGHAGVPELNHLDIIDQFGQHFQNSEIICPLAYGNPDYIQNVKDFGQKTFGESFKPMEDYLPRNEYYQVLKQSSFAVFGSLIHQGFGNIMTLLQLGLKVFLFEQNPIYQQLKSMGMILFSLDEVSKEDFQIKLSPDQIYHNRKILAEVLSDEAVDGYYRSVYQLEAGA
ncbi:4-alpha-L-fucosyltransferase (glycosyl transferase family 56) [Algoriphagus boseongensis]|uniref:4-alpha-L-fucosyltransferase (Glycosyl transferase family 56) n=1 Tax=Algoriphagus boseongensis TaxID=1442587 RepID=A0A4R6TBM2_9BACT|nr:TDP-N-acetylfucosamine:lipid II N-acetylfucosaminyltransferase [Algoriphagus boseongensis]TDQ19643.1 4-alpha-L-fucosyltransferase (glycosyl transferase family 56) [Algoriphagus boseongensis]